ncbi:MAG: hypothetical protein QOG72_1722 [Sphingomonadales bacterium]|jgi:hypothetical protein|nr:hypothetical protein [Sphingomonadales bacterium]
MSAALEAFAKPSAAFVMSLLRSYAPGSHAELAEAIHGLDWDEFAAAVSAMQRSLPAVLGPDAFPRLLVRQEAHENSGAEIIGYVADTVSEPHHRAIMKSHAADESRHASMFLALRRLLSPGKRVAALTSEEADPYLARYEGDLASFLWDTHFAEINSIFYLDSMRMAVSHPDATIGHKIDAALTKVIADERRHVASTASILSELFEHDSLMVERMRASFADHAAALREQAAGLASEFT